MSTPPPPGIQISVDRARPCQVCYRSWTRVALIRPNGPCPICATCTTNLWAAHRGQRVSAPTGQGQPWPWPHPRLCDGCQQNTSPWGLILDLGGVLTICDSCTAKLVEAHPPA